jgi:hypothetical protein
MSGFNRVVLSNLWLFKPLLLQEFQKSGPTEAMVRGDVPIAVELRRADVARNECYAALVTWATGLTVMRSW